MEIDIELAQDEELFGTGWSIENDSTADWAVQRIKEERKDRDRLVSVCEEKISYYGHRAMEIKERCAKRTDFLTAKLEEYFETVSPKETKTQRKYELVSGALVQTKPKQQMECEDSQLIDWMKVNGYEAFVKTTEKPAWGDFKKRLAITSDGIVVTDQGELVEGVTVSEAPAKFDIK